MLKRNICVRMNPLYRLTFNLDKSGEQYFMAVNNFSECALQGRYFQPTCQAYCQEDVIERALWLQAMQEPQTLLRERKRQERAFRTRSNWNCVCLRIVAGAHAQLK